MTAMPSLRRILADTPGTPVDLDYNYQTVETHIGNELVNRDGSVAMTAPLAGPDAVNPTEYATLQQVQAQWPTGSIITWAGARTAVPAGWALCDGTLRNVGESEYADLYNAIGTTYGGSDGVNFNLPNLQQRIPVGQDPAEASFDTVGNEGGDKDGVAAHTHDQTNHDHSIPNHKHNAGSSLVTSENGAHNHTLADGRELVYRNTSSGAYTLGGGGQQVSFTGTFEAHDGHTHNVQGETGTQTATIRTGNGNSGGANDPTQETGTAEGNMQPYVVMNYIIKL